MTIKILRNGARQGLYYIAEIVTGDDDMRENASLKHALNISIREQLELESYFFKKLQDPFHLI